MNIITSSTSLYGLVGYPVEHSLSPIFWNKAFEKLNYNAAYIALSVHPDDILTCLKGLKVSGFKGLNITRPHKFAAADFCNILYEAAKETGVVNTVKFSSSNEIEGWNTDAIGFLNLMKRFELPSTIVTVLGDGASSKSIIWALKEYGILQINQIARKFSFDIEEKNEIYKNKKIFFRKLSWNLKNFTNSIKESDIIINTTPIGWHENDSIEGFEESLDTSKCFVDLNYNEKSKLLKFAKHNCGITIDGRELLYEQGVEAFKVLTNYAPPAEIIRRSIFDYFCNEM